MHQTFYIDLDEEISSVIDRLNKSVAADNHFVVPKRAIFLQSIVNLKLLKREADKVGKHVVIVTQDEVGASMASRSGIDVRGTVEGLEMLCDTDDEVMEEDARDEIPPVAVHPQQKKQIRLNGVGSSDFYDSTVGLTTDGIHLPVSAKKVGLRSAAVNSAAAMEKRAGIPKREAAQVPLRGTAQIKLAAHIRPPSVNGLRYEGKLDIGKEKTLEKMYSLKSDNAQEKAMPVAKTDGRIKKVFVGFIGLCLLAFIGVAGYLFWPSAKIVIEPNILKNKINLDLHGGTDITQVDQLNIPIRVIDKEESISLSYDVKGGPVAAGKKARGNVVIYNEYDSSAQTLIATTRLESENGKIFRLVKSVVIPGATTIAGEVKPGAITAEVIADQVGPEYNIEPTKFTIPGFKDGPKYGKFYAKSAEQMMGGSIDGETAGGTVSQQDIDSAKKKTEAELKSKLSQAIKGELNDGEIVIEQAEKVTITKSAADVKLGDMVSAFEYVAVASVHALVFSENDVKMVLGQSSTGDQQVQDGERYISKVEYGTVDADFDKNLLEMKVYGEITITPRIDVEQIKSDLLGKTDDQLPLILRRYATIKSVNVEFQPTFVSRIPQYAQRVKVEVKKNAE